MNPRTTAILFALAAALAAFVYFYEIKGEQARLDAKAAENRLFRDLEQGEIESIALRAADAPEIRFERRDAHWRIVSPLDAAADAFAVDGLAGAIAQLSSESLIEQPRALDVYGIGAQSAEVRFRAGGSEKILRLGKTTPVGANTYVAIDGDARLFTVVTYQLQPFRKELDEFRDKQLVVFDRAAVKGIRVSSSDAKLVLARGDDGWRVTSPVDDRADADSVEQLLSSLTFLRASGFVDDPLDDAATGLASPDLAIELEIPPQEGAAEPTIARFEVGGVTPGGSDRYARGSSGALYTVAQSSLDDIGRRVVDYRDLRLAEFNVDDARRVELGFHTAAGETFAIRVERTPEGWASDAEPIDASRVDELVRALASLRATDVVAEQLGADELAAMGFEPARAMLSVHGDGEAPTALAEIHLGVAFRDGITARRGDRPIIYRIDAADAELLPTSIESFRERYGAQPSSDAADDSAADAATDPASGASAPDSDLDARADAELSP